MLSKTAVKYIQSLAHKKLREEEGVFIAEGPKVVEELLSNGKFAVKMLCGQEEWFKHNHLADEVTETYAIDMIQLEKISLLSTPNKVVGVFYQQGNEKHDIKGKLSIMLDDIRDPGNMGTIIRIADWFGIRDIICSEECVEMYNPKVVQASMGSITRVNCYYTNLLKFIPEHKNINVYAAALEGEDISHLGKVKEGIVLIGNEAHGINPEILSLCFRKINIPRYGKAESLNAAVACGIILSHLK